MRQVRSWLQATSPRRNVHKEEGHTPMLLTSQRQSCASVCDWLLALQHGGGRRALTKTAGIERHEKLNT